MAKTKKTKYDWWQYRNTQYAFCDNSDHVLSVHTYGDNPNISFFLSVAEYTPRYTASKWGEFWQNGTPEHTQTGPLWYYLMSASVGHARLILTKKPGWCTDTQLTNQGIGYATRHGAIKAGLCEFVTACDLVLSSDPPAPFWSNRRQEFLHPIGREQLPYYLCLPEWEPMWQLLEEMTRHDDWLAEMRQPKKAVFVKQLSLL